MEKLLSLSPNQACLHGKLYTSAPIREFIHQDSVTHNKLAYSTSFRHHGSSLICKASNDSYFGLYGNDANLSPWLAQVYRSILNNKYPILSEVSDCCIPVIDMDEAHNIVIDKVARACEEYGFFQIINHKIPQELCKKMLNAAMDVFHMPLEDKVLLLSDDPNKDVRICHHYRKDQATQEKIKLWSEVFKHSWHPVDDFTHTLPINPPQYREVMATYAKHIGGLMTLLLSLMSEGLGLEPDCLNDRIKENPTCRVQANYYQPCPNPKLTLGLGDHTDRDGLTVILPSPDVQGLQVMKDGNWITVDPIPGALVVNVGDQLQVLSNGKYKSVLHRAITNKIKSRLSVAMFYGPGKDTIIGPIDDLVDDKHPPVYRSYRFSEFLDEFRRQEGNRRWVKEAFQLRPLEE